MKEVNKDEFLEAVANYGLGTESNENARMTAHTSAVTTNDWKKIQEEISKKED